MASEQRPRFFLFIGSGGDSESATSRLKTTGTLYVKKMLESRPQNWDSIADLLESPELIGTVIKLSGFTCESMLHPQYKSQARRILERLSVTHHVLFIHEAVLSEAEDEEEKEEDYLSDPIDYDSDEHLNFLYRRHVFHRLNKEQRDEFIKLIDQYQLNFIPYARNAELSTLASSFIESSDKKLLFRVYVPTGKLWAAEADKLLTLFRDWLTRIKGQRIRQDGYTTRNGEVYEFYGTEDFDHSDLSSELKQFSDFLDLCIEAPDEATALLANQNAPAQNVAHTIEKYAREARRLKIDLKHARETRLLTIRQQLESELLDSHESAELSAQLSNSLVPRVESFAHSLSLGLPHTNLPLPPGTNVVINQQFIQTVNGIVARELNGEVNFGPEAAQLMEIISKFGGQQTQSLVSDVHEVEDEDSSQVDRLAAKQRLKGFLTRLGEQVSSTAMSVLQKYLESKMGL